MSEFTLQKTVRDAVQAQLDADGSAVAASPLVERTVRFTPTDPGVDETVTLFTAAEGEKVLALIAKVLAKPTTWGDAYSGAGVLTIDDVAHPQGYGYLNQSVLSAAGDLIVPPSPLYGNNTPVYAAGDVVQASYTAGRHDELQYISLSPFPASGEYTLTFEGQTTAPISWDANVAAVQAALEALSSVGAGNIVVSGDNPLSVLFQNALSATNVPLITSDWSTLVAPDNASTVITVYANGEGGYDPPTGPVLDVLIKFLIWKPTWA